MKVTNVAIDNREQDRVDKAKEYYLKQGLDITVSTLTTGDYLFNDQVVFEYKTLCLVITLTVSLNLSTIGTFLVKAVFPYLNEP